MKRFAIACMCLAMVATVANAEDLRLFFSASDDVSAAPAEWVNEENLVLDAPGTAYLWADVMDAGIWNGLAFGLNSPMAGTGEMLLPSFSGLLRWNPGSDNTGDLMGTDNYNLAAIQELGIRNPKFILDDLALDVDGHSLHLLGEINVTEAMAGDELYISVGTQGISRSGGNPETDVIFFGFGDAGVAGNDFGAQTTMADLSFVPEPASFLLLGLAGLALRRR